MLLRQKAATKPPRNHRLTADCSWLTAQNARDKADHSGVPIGASPPCAGPPASGKPPAVSEQRRGVSPKRAHCHPVCWRDSSSRTEVSCPAFHWDKDPGGDRETPQQWRLRALAGEGVEFPPLPSHVTSRAMASEKVKWPKTLQNGRLSSCFSGQLLPQDRRLPPRCPGIHTSHLSVPFQRVPGCKQVTHGLWPQGQ